MAKNQGRRKATTAPSGQTTDDAPAEEQAAAARPSPTSTDRELLEGSDQTRLFIELLKKMGELAANQMQTTAAVTEIGSQIGELAKGPIRRTDEGLTDLYNKIDGIPKSPAPETVEELAQKRSRELIVTEQRKSLWVLERRSPERADSIHQMPRSSVIGRVLHDLGAFAESQGQVPGEIFKRLECFGKHHLSSVIERSLNKYTRPDGSKDTAVSGELGRQLQPRIEPLIRLGYAGKGSKGYYLTPEGRQVFKGWPDYQASDGDNDCGGYRKDAGGGD